MRRRKLASSMTIWAALAVLAGCGATETTPIGPDTERVPALTASQAPVLATTEMHHNRGDGALGTVYVKSQGLYYDTFVTAETLPSHGRFQLLVNGETDYGPGDPGYLGGRWKIPNKEGGYDYLLCPLLPPGRSTP